MALTFTSATTPPTVAAAQQLTNLSAAADGSSASRSIGTQYVAFSAISDTSSGSATVVVFLADKDSVGSFGQGKFRQVTLTIAVTSTRTSHSTAAGGYVCTVTSSEPPLRNTVDVFGFGKDWPRVYVACTALTTITSLTIIAIPGRAI